MLLAVIIGLEQSPRSAWFKRRWMRRLLFVSFRRMLGFTRNPSVRPVVEKSDTPLDAGNHKGFRVSQKKIPPNAGDFACLRANDKLIKTYLSPSDPTNSSNLDDRGDSYVPNYTCSQFTTA